jgi:hypothetical protein
MREQTAGEEIPGHASRNCLSKKKKNFFSESENNFSAQFSILLMLQGTIHTALVQMNQ